MRASVEGFEILDLYQIRLKYPLIWLVSGGGGRFVS